MNPVAVAFLSGAAAATLALLIGLLMARSCVRRARKQRGVVGRAEPLAIGAYLSMSLFVAYSFYRLVG